MVNFSGNKEDYEIAEKIAERVYNDVLELSRSEGVVLASLRTRLDWEMDVMAVHLNGCPLRLKDLLEADDFNFAHDLYGIYRHLNRETGKLEDCFLPRFSARD
jgi:hypothetical protein